MYTCEYCGSEFKLNWMLTRHQKTAKSCLRQRGEQIPVNVYTCSCGKEFKTRNGLKYHSTRCNIPIQPQLTTTTPDQQLQTLITAIQEMVTAQKEMLATTSRSNITVQNMQPLTDEHLKEGLEHLTLDFIADGAKGYAAFANYYSLKDNIVCTDKSRKKFKYRDENGNLINDGGGTKLAQRFFQAISSKNEELINNEYNILQREVAQIAIEGRAHTADITSLLEKATKLQELLFRCKEAARGEENDLTSNFIAHLTKLK